MKRIVMGLFVQSIMASLNANSAPLKVVPSQLNESKAYILVEYKLTRNKLRLLPGSREFVPLIEGLSFARYDPALADVRGAGRAVTNPVPAKQAAVEPFRSRELQKGPGSRLFLLEVEPDIWVVQSWGTTSFSLGSYRFKLEPGIVTDLGIVTAAPDWAEGDGPPTAGDVASAVLLGPFAKHPKVAPARAEFRPRTPDDMTIPASIPADRVRPVIFTAGARFGNYTGGLVNRIEGVNAVAKARQAASAPTTPTDSVR